MATKQRPYFQYGIVELEKLTENSPNNSRLLRSILFELGFRKTERPKKLKLVIEKRFEVLGTSRKTSKAKPKDMVDLFDFELPPQAAEPTHNLPALRQFRLLQKKKMLSR